MNKPFTTPPFKGFEMLIMRILFAAVVWDVFPRGLSLHQQPKPSGLAHFLDLTFLSDPQVLQAGNLVLLAALIVYCTGRFLWLALPLMFLLTTAAGSLVNSQGAITHSTQLPALVILVQCAYYTFQALRSRLKKIPPADAQSRVASHRTATFMAQQAVVSAYLITALTKIMASGLVGWISDARYFPLQLMKTDRMDYYNTLVDSVPEATGFFAPLTNSLRELFTANTAVTQLFLASGLFFELFAFLALMGRRWNFAYGCLIILFHLTVSAVMDLHFQYNIYLFAIFFLNLPYWTSRPFASHTSTNNTTDAVYPCTKL